MKFLNKIRPLIPIILFIADWMIRLLMAFTERRALAAVATVTSRAP